MRKKVVLFGLITSMTLGLTGCGSSSDIAKLNSLQALNSESTVSTYNLTTSEKEDAVYAKVVARQLLDLSSLDACAENEKQQVLQFMNSVDSQLCGQLDPKQGVIDEAYTNYLLMEFEKTPYYWQRSQTNIRGIDAESRSIVVDVTYKTINYKKSCQRSSYLVQGEPNYTQKMAVRYNRWMHILELKYRGGDVHWQGQYKKFKSVYGNPKDIFKSQRNLSLTENIYNTGNQKTYKGLTDSMEEDSNGTMVIRYILTPSYTLGINTGMQCSHMYRVSYELDNDCTEGLEIFNDEGYATISDNVYKLLYSYFTCIDESDFTGLYSLTKNFKDSDKYYEDYFETTYRKHDGFTVSLFDIAGTKVKCGITVSSKTRAKGANVSSPLYKDRYYVELELVNGKLQLTNIVLLSSTLEGEPTIDTKDAQTSGFTSGIDLEVKDKQDIEGLISNFSSIQLLKDTTSDAFGDIVDTSIGQSQLSQLKHNMTSITGNKKVVWLKNYMQGTSNYASVKCRELFQKKDNSIYEADVMYNFISKGNKWYIYGYDINSVSKLDTTNLITTGNLCICKAGKVESLTSQVVDTTGSKSTDKVDNVGTVYEHDVYTPIKKKGVHEKGLVKLQPKSIDSKQLESMYKELALNLNLSCTSAKELIEKSKQNGVSCEGMLKEVSCFYYNFINNRYTSRKEFVDAQTPLANKLKAEFSDYSQKLDEDTSAIFNSLVSWVSGLKYSD